MRNQTKQYWVLLGCTLLGCAAGGGDGNGTATGGSGGEAGMTNDVASSAVSMSCDRVCKHIAAAHCGETYAQCYESCNTDSSDPECAEENIAANDCLAAADLYCDSGSATTIGDCILQLDETSYCSRNHVKVEGCVEEKVIKFDHTLSDIIVENNRAYFFMNADSDCYGLFIYDVSNPAAPVKLGNLDGVCADDFVVKNAMVYASSLSPQLLVAVDASNPAAPVGAGSVGLSGQITLSGNTAYLQDILDLTPVNITNPAAMTAGEPVHTFGQTTLAVGNVLYVAGLTSTLAAYDISTPLSPVSIGEWGAGLSTTQAAMGINGNTLYIVSDDGVYPFEITNPTAPVAALPYLHSVGARDIAFIGNTAYAGGYGASAIDISNPQALRLIGSLGAADPVGHVTAIGNYLYVTTERALYGQGHLHILHCG